jgi:glutamate-1-semialdehyde 2,1-aminomutase
LDAVGPGDYDVLCGRTARLATGLTDAIAAAGLPVTVPVAGPLVGVFFAPGPITDAAGARAAAAGGLYAEFFWAMLERGVALAPGPYEAMFPGLAHGDAEIDAVIDAAGDAAAAVKEGGPPRAPDVGIAARN